MMSFKAVVWLVYDESTAINIYMNNSGIHVRCIVDRVVCSLSQTEASYTREEPIKYCFVFKGQSIRYYNASFQVLFWALIRFSNFWQFLCSALIWKKIFVLFFMFWHPNFVLFKWGPLSLQYLLSSVPNFKF